MTNGAQPAKKGLSPVAWIAIGCGGLAILAILAVAAVVDFGVFKAKEYAEDFQANPAKTAAETIVKLNPDLELKSADDEAGTITFENTKTGEVATLNFGDIAEGKFSVTTDEGEFSVDASDAGEGGGVTMTGPEGEARFGASASLEDVPDWVPVYPDASETQSSDSSNTPQGVGGMITAQTGDKPQQVIDHFKKWFEDEGYEIKATTTNTTPQGGLTNINGELASEGRTLNVTVTEQSGEVQVMVTYSGNAE